MASRRYIHTPRTVVTSDAKGACARLGDVETPGSRIPGPASRKLQTRIADTIAFVEGVPPERFEGSERRIVTMKTRDATLGFPGQPSPLHVVLPNAFFHVSTAYAIPRHPGVPCG